MGTPWVSGIPGAVKGRLTDTTTLPQESHNTSKGPEATWRLSKVQFVYDSSEKTHFKDAVSGECSPAGLGRSRWRQPWCSPEDGFLENQQAFVFPVSVGLGLYSGEGDRSTWSPVDYITAQGTRAEGQPVGETLAETSLEGVWSPGYWTMTSPHMGFKGARRTA